MGQGNVRLKGWQAAYMRALPLHEKYTQVEGPIEAYKTATGDWTPAMQQEYAEACASADQPGIVSRVEYRCPECRAIATGIQVDYVTFYEDSDRLHYGPVVAEAQLIRIEDCGHSYRRGAI